MDVRARHNVNVMGVPGAPVLLLVHGFGCDQNLWRPVAGILSADFQLVLIDHIGCGQSDAAAWDPQKYSSLDGYADDIVDLVDALDLEDVVLVGHSVSAMIGALAVIKKPARFAKLIMLTPSPRYVDDDGYRGGFSRPDIDELLASMEMNYLGWSHAMAPVIMGNPDRGDLHQQLEAVFCRTDPARARVFAKTTFLSDNRADLARIPLPTLVIECEHDAIAPQGVGAYVRDRIPTSALVTLAANGHCPHVSNPDITAQAIAEFAATP